MQKYFKSDFFRSNYFYWLIILWGAYAVINLFAPIDTVGAAKYDISNFESYVLRISFQIPIFLIWLAVFFGSFHISRYFKKISNISLQTTNNSSDEVKGFRYLSFALHVLLSSLVISSYIAIPSVYTTRASADYLDVKMWTTLITQYSSIILTFTYFCLFLLAAKHFFNLISINKDVAVKKSLAIIAVLLFSVYYVYTVFTNPDRVAPTSNPAEILPVYYVSDFWIFLTIVVPYITIWIIGVISVIYFNHFAKYVDGIIYRKAFSLLGRGVSSVILLSMFLQMLSQFGGFFAGTSLGILLAVIYLLLIFIAVSYALIAKGAEELSKLENI